MLYPLLLQGPIYACSRTVSVAIFISYRFPKDDISRALIVPSCSCPSFTRPFRGQTRLRSITLCSDGGHSESPRNRNYAQRQLQTPETPDAASWNHQCRIFSPTGGSTFQSVRRLEKFVTSPQHKQTARSLGLIMPVHDCDYAF